jgi:hypothetical protein
MNDARPAFAAVTAQALAVFTAFGLARKNPAHRPIAIGLACLLALSVLRAALVYGVLRPERAAMADPAAPFSSPLALAAVYLDGAAFLAETLGTAAIVAAVYLEKPRRPLVALAGAWLLASVTLAVLYPSPLVRGAGLARVYLAAGLASVAVSIACVLRFAQRRISPRAPQAVALFLLAADVAVLLTGPWRASIFVGWDSAKVVLLVAYVFIAGIQGVLWRFSPSPR